MVCTGIQLSKEIAVAVTGQSPNCIRMCSIATLCGSSCVAIRLDPGGEKQPDTCDRESLGSLNLLREEDTLGNAVLFQLFHFPDERTEGQVIC